MIKTQLVLLSSLLLYFSLPLIGQDITFGPQQPLFEDLGFNSHQYGFLAGDFNGDGNTDFAGITSVGVTAFVNKGDMTFDTISLYNGLDFPIDVADMNNDGRDDLVGGDFYYSADESGTFTRTTLGIDGFHFVRQAGDLNKDGFADLVVENRPGVFEDPVMYIYWNNKGESFEEATLESENIDFGFTLMADYNRDGWVDILIPDSFADRIYLYKNSPEGTFTRSAVNVDTYVHDLYLKVGDMDGDIDMDILSGNPAELSEGLYFLENQNQNFFNRELILADKELVSLEISDLDQDGDSDVVCILYQSFPNPIHTIGIIQNLGGGSWGNFEPMGTYSGLQSLAYQNPNFFDNWLEVTDLNGDERPDILVTKVFQGEVVWYLNETISSLKDLQKVPELSVYPMPANDVVNILSGELDIQRVSIFAFSGNLILDQLLDESGEINVSALASGIYMCAAYDDEGRLAARTKVSIIR